MTDPDISKEKQHEQELYSAIGEFIFWFSQLEFTIKARLAGALELDDQLFDIVIGPYDFAMLCTVTEKTLGKGNPAQVKEIEKYFNQCRKLNQETRVTVAHGSWTTGGARQISRNTLEAKLHFADLANAAGPADIRKLRQETTKAKTLMRQLFQLGAVAR
jgi:hypothetical protein